MTEDTKRALEIIKPIASEFGISVNATDKTLLLDGIEIGISMNSTWATLWEFVGYLMVRYSDCFRNVRLTDKQLNAIKRYWRED